MHLVCTRDRTNRDSCASSGRHPDPHPTLPHCGRTPDHAALRADARLCRTADGTSDHAAIRAVMVGRSPILGTPIGMLLLGRNATVTFCHSRTPDLAQEVSRADIVVAAVGKAGLIRGSWIKPGATVVDAGYNPGNVGDVTFEEAAERAGLITPVPGGVGPMTIAVLLRQTVDAALSMARLPA